MSSNWPSELPRTEARASAPEPTSAELGAFRFRIQPDADITFFLVSPSVFEKSCLQNQIAKKQGGSCRRNAGNHFTNQTVMQEIAAHEHDGLLRFCLHCDYQCLKRDKANRISVLWIYAKNGKYLNFPSRNSSKTQFPDGKFLIRLRQVLGDLHAK